MKAILLPFAFFLSLSTPLWAINPPTYTLQSVLETVFAKNPSLHGAQEKVHEAEAGIPLVRALIFPTLSAVANVNYKKDATNTEGAHFGGEPYNQYDFNFKLSQPLFSWGV